MYVLINVIEVKKHFKETDARIPEEFKVSWELFNMLQQAVLCNKT